MAFIWSWPSPTHVPIHREFGTWMQVKVVVGIILINFTSILFSLYNHKIQRHIGRKFNNLRISVIPKNRKNHAKPII